MTTAWEDTSPATGHAPHNADAERVILDALMSNPDLAADTGLLPIHFYVPRHAAIHNAIMGLHADGDPTDPIAVVARLATSGELQRVGGAAYVHELYTSPLVGLAATWHFAEVIEKAQLRWVSEAGRRMDQLAHVPGADPGEVTAKAHEWLAGLSESTIKAGPVRWAAALDDTIAALESAHSEDDDENTTPKPVPTGLIDMDRLLGGGLRPGQLIVVAGRPGMGKSVFGVDVVLSAAFRHQIPAHLVSLEMSRSEIARRALAALYRIPLHHLNAGQLTDDEWVYLARNASQDTEAPLWIDDSANHTMASIAASARRMTRMHGSRLMVLDYLQLVQSTGRTENRQQEVSNLSRGLKLLAKELQIPVVVCAQLNRKAEDRSDKRPQLSDLRESGAIEQDADVVILLHRDDYYEKESGRAGEADLIVAKHRNGPTDTITCAFQGHFSRFVDMAVGV